jgi:hypothetical protein
MNSRRLMGVALKPRITIYHIIEAGSGGPCAGQQNWVPDFRYGSSTAMPQCPRHVCFTPMSGHELEAILITCTATSPKATGISSCTSVDTATPLDEISQGFI